MKKALKSQRYNQDVIWGMEFALADIYAPEKTFDNPGFLGLLVGLKGCSPGFIRGISLASEMLYQRRTQTFELRDEG